MTETPLQEIGGRIREIRESLHLTIRPFAKLLLTSPTTLSLVENGQRDPSFPIIRELRLRYGISIDDMIDETCNGSKTNE